VCNSGEKQSSSQASFTSDSSAAQFGLDVARVLLLQRQEEGLTVPSAASRDMRRMAEVCNKQLNIPCKLETLTKSKSKLRYDWTVGQSASQTILLSSSRVGPMTKFLLSSVWILLDNIQRFSPNLTGNRLPHRCRDQPVNAVWENSRCLLEEERRLLYDWRPISQYALVSSTLVGLATRYYFLSECCCLTFTVLFLWGVLSDERTGSAICSVIIQWSESRRTRNHTLLSHLRLPQPGEPGSRIYIPQEQGGPGTRCRCLLWEPYGTHRYSPYLTGKRLPLRYRDQPVNAVWGNSRCLLWQPYGNTNTLCG
jgi:hypothetical protein